MKKKKRLSPFEELYSLIEQEICDLVLKAQLYDEYLNSPYWVGYRVALNYMLDRATAIYNRGWRYQNIGTDYRKLDAHEEILKAKKRGG